MDERAQTTDESARLRGASVTLLERLRERIDARQKKNPEGGVRFGLWIDDAERLVAVAEAANELKPGGWSGSLIPAEDRARLKRLADALKAVTTEAEDTPNA